MIAFFFLVLLALFALLSINRSMKAKKDFNSRPLVLIHEPLNHEIVETGEMVTVHATARETSVGLSAVELWVNDVLVAERPAPEGEPPQSLLLMENWTPTVPGSHVVIVRATATNGVLGQATVVVEVEEGDGSMTGVYPVEEGDTLASIADEVGTTPEDLAALNPDLGGEEPAPGDDLDLPDPDYSDEEAGGDRTEDGEPEPGGDEPGGGDDDGAVPDPEEPEPGDSGPFPDMGGETSVFPDMGGDDIGFTGEPTGLRLEVVRLRASPTTERLYCYVHLGLQPTLRVPDADGDPATDETFAPLGGDFWDTEPYLVGSPAPVVYWPDEEDLPFDVSCTGVAAGGTDALDMGSFDIDIPPENWDGTLRDQTAVGSEGAYFVAYRVSRVTDLRDVPLYQDPDMTAPTNVALNETSGALTWDYLPRAGEEAITGFRVYLNGTLQWVEDASARQSELPPEWFNPPCGSTYTFAVTAYRFDLPDGPESPPGEASLTAPTEGEGCRVQIALNFTTLETYDLGSDGRYEDRTGDVGPPYGEFFANEWEVTFDGRPDDRWGGGLDTPMGLEHNTVYDLNEAAADTSWRFSMQPSTVVFLAEGESLEFGFNIKDQDTGYCHDGDEPGCADNICHGSLIVTEGLDLHREGSILSTNSRCRVSYNYGPAPGSPAAGGAAGEVPLPWIEVEGVSVYEPTGLITVRVRNGGSAAWAGQDLEVGLEYRDGTPIGIETWEALELGAGERRGLGTSDITLEPPYDVCVTVDPNDLVTEYYEASGTRQPHPLLPAAAGPVDQRNPIPRRRERKPAGDSREHRGYFPGKPQPHPGGLHAGRQFRQHPEYLAECHHRGVRGAHLYIPRDIRRSPCHDGRRLQHGSGPEQHHRRDGRGEQQPGGQSQPPEDLVV